VHISDVVTKLQEEKVKLAVCVKEAQENQRRYLEELESLKISCDVNELPSTKTTVGNPAIQVRKAQSQPEARNTGMRMT
jgi:hypothetical protein